MSCQVTVGVTCGGGTRRGWGARKSLKNAVRTPSWLYILLGGISQVLWPWGTCLQRGGIFLKPLVIMPTDLHQEGKIFRGNREFRQWQNRLKTGKLRNMDLVGTKRDGW